MPVDRLASAGLPAPALSIVIVNWHSKDYVRQCIQSIERCGSSLSYEIVVIDSGSFDGCGEMLRLRHPDVRFLQSRINLGFGRANTMAAQEARGQVILFLNPDTAVTRGAIERMHSRLLALPRAGAVGCRLLNSDGSLQTSAVQAFPTISNHLLNADVIRRWLPRASLFGARALFAGEQGATEVDAVSGACLMVRREVFARAGGFSPEYFMYGEDLDFCFKTRSLGLRNYHVSDAVVIHHGGGSTQRTVSRFAAVMTVDSINRLVSKTRGAAYGVGHRLGTTIVAVIRLAMLGLVAPVALARGAGDRWLATARKWTYILRWGLGFERWTTEPVRRRAGG